MTINPTIRKSFGRRGFIRAALAAGVGLWVPRPRAGILLLRHVAGPNEIPTAGLLGHWPLTQASQCTDTSGNGNNGTPHNSFGNSTTSNHSGVANGAIVINSVGNQYATFPNIWASDWSVCLWVKCNADATGSYNRIIGQTNYLTDFALHLDTGVNKPVAYDGSWSNIGSGMTGWQVGEWHHVAITRTASGPTGEFYFDGAANNAETHTAFSTTIYLGADYQGISPGNISVAEMLIYNRALSAGEVAQIYGAT